MTGRLAALTSAAALLVVSASGAGAPLPPPAGGYDYREGVAESADLARLVDRPTLIDTQTYAYDDETGEWRMSGWTDAHAVYDLPLSAFMAVAIDYQNYASYVPRIFSASVTERSDGHAVVRFYVGISFLGAKVAYETVEEVSWELRADGTFLARTRLVDSLDGELFEHYTSLYLAPVTVGGATMTYVRYFNRPGVRKPFPGMVTISRMFTPGETKAQMTALAKETARRLSPP